MIMHLGDLVIVYSMYIPTIYIHIMITIIYNNKYLHIKLLLPVYKYVGMYIYIQYILYSIDTPVLIPYSDCVKIN